MCISNGRCPNHVSHSYAMPLLVRQCLSVSVCLCPSSPLALRFCLPILSIYLSASACMRDSVRASIHASVYLSSNSASRASTLTVTTVVRAASKRCSAHKSHENCVCLYLCVCRAASCSMDGAVRIWDVHKGVCLAESVHDNVKFKTLTPVRGPGGAVK